jgi:hypothetical protein
VTLNVTIVSVLPARVRETPPWAAGPLNLTWRSGSSQAIASDAVGRSRYTSPYVPKALYRTDSEVLRYHQRLNCEMSMVPGTKLFAVEWLLLPSVKLGPNCLLAIHFETRTVASLAELTDVLYGCTNFHPVHAAGLREEIEGHLGGTTTVDRDARRALNVSLIDGLGSEEPKRSGLDRYDALDKRNVLLAIATEQGRFLPDPAAKPAEPEYRSAAYRVQVGRYGLAIVEGPEGPAIADKGLRFWTRGFFVDVLLLVAAQELAVAAVQATAGDMLLNPRSAVELRQLQGDALEIHNRYLLSSFAPQGPYDILLQRLQEARRLPAALDRLSHSTDQLGQLIQAQIGHDTNILLLVLAIVSFPLATALSIWSGFSSRSDRGTWLLLALVVAAIAAFLLSQTAVARRAFGGRQDRKSK